MKIMQSATCVALLLIAISGVAAAQDDATFTGTVVSSSRQTLTVRGSNGQFQLFVFDRNTTKPASIPNGSEVRVISALGDDPSVRVASEVTITQAAAARSTTGAADPVVPPAVRQVERDIKRDVKRFQMGVRAGVALDPELVLIGVQSQIGPFFTRDIYFRPSVEFGWGEVTAMFSLNPEIIYRLPVSSRTGRWSSYLGVGPGFNFLHQNFEKTTNSGSRIDFGDFHSDVGLNILGGLRYRSGMFMELKTSVYSRPAPTLRLVIGYNF